MASPTFSHSTSRASVASRVSPLCTQAILRGFTCLVLRTSQRNLETDIVNVLAEAYLD